MNCSICSATGFLHLIVPHEHFTLERGEDKLTSYRFGSGAANHLFCSVCGVKSFYQPRSHPEAWSVNANALDDCLPLDIEHFDGRMEILHWPDEVARREADAALAAATVAAKVARAPIPQAA